MQAASGRVPSAQIGRSGRARVPEHHCQLPDRSMETRAGEEELAPAPSRRRQRCRPAVLAYAPAVWYGGHVLLASRAAVGSELGSFGAWTSYVDSEEWSGDIHKSERTRVSGHHSCTHGRRQD
jgi:hypothetical protein